MRDDFEIIVHRGHNLNRGENSFAGVEEIRDLVVDFLIEIDVCITADDIPILHHDLSFDRLCGDPRLVAETKYDDLPERHDGEAIVRLDEMLERFPDQPFLLDLRTGVHADFLRDSNISIDEIDPPLKLIVPAVEKLMRNQQSTGSRFIVSVLEHREYLMNAIPGFEVDIAENYGREYLASMPGMKDSSIFGENQKRIYVRFREVTPELIAWAHKVGLKIIANHAPSRRSLETSRMMLEKSFEWGMDGLTTSPIDKEFVDYGQNAVG